MDDRSLMYRPIVSKHVLPSSPPSVFGWRLPLPNLTENSAELITLPLDSLELSDIISCYSVALHTVALAADQAVQQSCKRGPRDSPIFFEPRRYAPTRVLSVGSAVLTTPSFPDAE